MKVSVEDVKTLFPSDLEEMLSFEEVGDYIVVRPRRFLGGDNFAKIASIVRQVGGEYVSLGKKSHFKIKREITTAQSLKRQAERLYQEVVLLREESEKLEKERKRLMQGHREFEEHFRKFKEQMRER